MSAEASVYENISAFLGLKCVLLRYKRLKGGSTGLLSFWGPLLARSPCPATAASTRKRNVATTSPRGHHQPTTARSDAQVRQGRVLPSCRHQVTTEQRGETQNTVTKLGQG